MLLRRRFKQERLHLGGRCLLHVWKHVGIGVEGEGNACVPQLFGDNLGGNTGAERQSCRSVTQIVKPDARQFGPIEYDLKVPLDEVPFIQWVAARIHEDQIRRRDIAIAGIALPDLGVAVIGQKLEDRCLKLHQTTAAKRQPPPLIGSSVLAMLTVPLLKFKSGHLSARYSLGRMPVVRASANNT